MAGHGKEGELTMVWPLLIGAALGAAKGYSDQQKEKRQRKAAAETARWSPWTGMQPGEIQQSDIVGSTAQGGLTGYSMEQNMDTQDALQNYLNSAATNQQATASATDAGTMALNSGVEQNPNFMGPSSSAAMPAQRGSPWAGAGRPAPAAGGMAGGSPFMNKSPDEMTPAEFEAMLNQRSRAPGRY